MNAADLKHRTVYRLARTVANPEPDRRRRGNHLNTTETWPEGLLIYAFVDTFTAKPHTYVRLSAKGYYNDLTPVHGGFAAFVDALEPVRTLDSILFGARQSLAIVTPDEILAELIDTHHVSLDEIEIVVSKLVQREEAAVAARQASHTGAPDGASSTGGPE
jgi:hypothetical protein